MLVSINFIPYLIQDGNTPIDFNCSRREKIDQANDMIRNLLSGYGRLIEYSPFETGGDKIKVVMEIDKNEQEILEYLTEYFGDNKRTIGPAAADSWLEGDMMLFDERDTCLELGINFSSFEVKNEIS